ncbi:MAG: DsbA family protein, partial [Methyloligellaceae bacterium]
MKKLIFSVFVLMIGGLSTSYADNKITPENKAQFETLIRDYLMKNPEVIRDAIQALQKKELEKRAALKQQLIEGNAAMISNDSTDPFIGNPDAKAVVVEFFDYNCGYCRRALPTAAKLIDNDKRVKYVFKEFPILSENSRLASEVSMAVWKIDPKKYRDFHWGIMKSPGRANETVLKKQIETIGMKWDEVIKVAKGKEVKAKLDANIELARKLGIDGTPSFIIGKKFFPGLASYEA